MKPLAFVVAIVVAACVSGCVGSVSEPDGPVRIMCLGDSITAGYTDNPDWNVPFEFGYRSGLYSLLAAAGHDIQFVGESPEPWDGRFGLPTNTPKLDLRGMGQDKHRGYGGASIEDLSQEVEGYIESDKPDVILLMIGINGVDANSPTQLESLVKRILATAPGVILIVARISPYAWFNQELWDYNLYISDGLIPTYAAEGYTVSTVDLYSLFLVDAEDPTSISPSGHSNKINHPSPALYTEMAQAWFDGLEPVLEKPGSHQGPF